MTACLRNNPSGMPARSGRLILLAGILAVFAVPAALPSAVRAEEPLRSGTIVSGASETPANPWPQGMEGCVGATTCSAWLQSGCAPALAGADPALQASIVDVADLADGVTTRTLSAVGLVVQFWRDGGFGLDGQGCEELLAERLSTHEDCKLLSPLPGCALRIPAAATFMTITGRPDTLPTEWTLR
jgi:hypothetical protein